MMLENSIMERAIEEFQAKLWATIESTIKEIRLRPDGKPEDAFAIQKVDAPDGNIFLLILRNNEAKFRIDVDCRGLTLTVTKLGEEAI